MNVVVLNDPPYGTERSHKGLRLARSVSKRDDDALRVFLLGDAVSCAIRGQNVPNSYYNLERMSQAITRGGAPSVGCCGTCLDAHGIAEEMLVEGPIQRGESPSGPSTRIRS